MSREEALRARCRLLATCLRDNGLFKELRQIEEATPLGDPPIVPLRELERRAVREALRQTRSVSRAARLLGIGRATLYRRLCEYGLDDCLPSRSRIPPSSPKRPKGGS